VAAEGVDAASSWTHAGGEALIPVCNYNSHTPLTYGWKHRPSQP